MDFLNKIAIIGVGLLGGSIGLACKEKYPHIHINGIGRSKEKLLKAVQLKIIDQYFIDVCDGVKDCDLVIICTPVMTIQPIFTTILPFLKKDALVTDVGSTKDEILKKIESIPEANKHFVGSHPMAGSEQSGMEAAKIDLYQNSLVIVTENPQTNHEALQKIELFWKSLGAKIKRMTSEKHDRIVCYTSHLPHLIASNLSFTLSQELTDEDINSRTYGNGLLDTTRIAEGDPGMWLDIFLSNQHNLLAAVQSFRNSLDEVEQLILNNDDDNLLDYLETGKQLRIKIAN